MSGISTHQQFAILETSQRGMSLMAHDSYEELTRSAVYACIMRSTPGSEHEVVKMLRDTIHDAVTDLHEESREGGRGIVTPSKKLEEIERALRAGSRQITELADDLLHSDDEAHAATAYMASSDLDRALTLARELRGGATETSVLRCTGPCGNTGWSSVICDCGAMETEAVPAVLITGEAE